MKSLVDILTSVEALKEANATDKYDKMTSMELHSLLKGNTLSSEEKPIVQEILDKKIQKANAAAEKATKDKLLSGKKNALEATKKNFKDTNYNKLNIRPSLDLSISKNPNADEEIFAQLGGWKGNLNRWTKEDIDAYRLKWSKELEVNSSLAKKALKNKEEKLINSEVTKEEGWDNLRKQLLSGNTDEIKSEIARSIAEYAKSKGMKSFKYSGDITDTIIKAKKGDTQCQGYLFILAAPTIISHYWKYVGWAKDETTGVRKGILAGKSASSWIPIAWEALTQNPSYLKNKDSNGNDTTTIDTLLKLDIDMVENLDISELVTHHSALSYFDIDKAQNAQNMEAFFCKIYSWFLTGYGIRENGLHYAMRDIEDSDDEGNKTFVRKRVLVDKLNQTSENAASTTLGAEGEKANLLDMAHAKQLADTGNLTNTDFSLQLEKEDDWEIFVRENMDLLFKKENDEYIGDKLSKFISDTTIPDADIGILAMNSGVPLDIFRSIGLDLMKDFPKNDKFYRTIISKYKKEYLSNKKLEHQLNSLDLSLENLKRIKEMAAVRDSDRSKNPELKKEKEEFLLILKSNFKKSLRKNHKMWLPIRFPPSFNFKSLRTIDLFHLWLRTKIAYPTKTFPKTVIGWKEELPNTFFEGDSDLHKLANYFVFMGYSPVPSRRKTLILLKFIYDTFFRKDTELKQTGKAYELNWDDINHMTPEICEEVISWILDPSLLEEKVDLDNVNLDFDFDVNKPLDQKVDLDNLNLDF
jgi:hypothetical protein